MSDININLQDVNSYFVGEAKAGRITAAMFRTWCDTQVGIIRRNELRGKRSTTNAKKQKSGKSAAATSKGSNSKGGGSKEPSSSAEKQSKKKGSSKEGPPKVSKADVADKSRMTALGKLDKALSTEVPQEILEGSWKTDGRPWLMSEASNDFYVRVNHELKTPPGKDLLPEGYDELSEKEQSAVVRRLNYNRLFVLADLTGEERSNSKSWIPRIQNRVLPDGFDEYGSSVPKGKAGDDQ